MTNKIKSIKEDQKIVYKCDDYGNLLQDTIKCAMCKQTAFFIVKETNEPLCTKCFEINRGIRLW